MPGLLRAWTGTSHPYLVCPVTRYPELRRTVEQQRPAVSAYAHWLLLIALASMSESIRFLLYQRKSQVPVRLSQLPAKQAAKRISLLAPPSIARECRLAAGMENVWSSKAARMAALLVNFPPSYQFWCRQGGSGVSCQHRLRDCC